MPCTNCNSTSEFIVACGFVTCSECGTVQDTVIDNSAEWRCFATEGVFDTSAVRCGAATLSDSVLTTTIVGGSRRLQQVHKWNTVSTKDRNVFQITKEFNVIGTEFHFQKPVIHSAINLYEKLYSGMNAQNYGVKRCSIRQGLKAACLFYACKQNGVGRERKEIGGIFGLSVQNVTRGCNTFVNVLGSDFLEVKPFETDDFCSRFCSFLDLSFDARECVERLIAFVVGLSAFKDVSPSIVVCVCISVVCEVLKLSISKKLISTKCGCSTGNICKYTRLLEPYRIELEAVVLGGIEKPEIEQSHLEGF